jgi:hypothetical protein
MDCERGTEMKSKSIHWFGLGLILAIGLIHLYLAPGEYGEAPYLGILFAVNFLMAVGAFIGIYYQKDWGWLLGALVSG